MNSELEKLLKDINENPDGITLIEFERKYHYKPKHINILLRNHKICLKADGMEYFSSHPYADDDYYKVIIPFECELEKLYTADGILVMTKAFYKYYPVKSSRRK